jgi:hypothetical protein
MSYSLAIWHSDLPMGPREASTFLDHLGIDWVVVRRRGEFDAFWQELLSRLPPSLPLGFPRPGLDYFPPHLLTTTADMWRHIEQARERSNVAPPRLPLTFFPPDAPWASSLLPMGCAIQLAIRPSYIERTLPVVFELASRHSLIVYDPQEGDVTPPPSLQGPADPLSVAVRLTLRIAGSAPPLEVHLILDGREVLRDVHSSRHEAHARARAVAIEHDLLFYEVVDPACLADLLR